MAEPEVFDLSLVPTQRLLEKLDSDPKMTPGTALGHDVSAAFGELEARVRLSIFRTEGRRPEDDAT